MPEAAIASLVRVKIDDVVYAIEGGSADVSFFYGKVLSPNIVVESSAWVLENPPTYENYPYRADIEVIGATSDCSPDVRFEFDGNYNLFAPVANAYTDKVMIYASEPPSGNIMIPVIILNNVQMTIPTPGWSSLEGFIYLNSAVLTTDWVNEASGGGTPTYENYPYRADINDPSGDITSDYSPDVRFENEEIASGIFAPVAGCSAGKIQIYASEIPANDITIPAIICTKII